MYKYRVCRVLVSKVSLERWKADLQAFKSLASQKGLSVGKALIPLMRSVDALAPNLEYFPESVKSSDYAAAFVIPKGKEREWDEAYNKVKILIIEASTSIGVLPIYAVLDALMRYAVQHPDVITPL